MCKAYGSRIFIQSHSTLVSNRTSKDVIPPLSLECDCCGGIDNTFKLNELHLHTPLRSVTSSLDDWRFASHKAEDVQNPVLEHDWKIKHSTVDSHLSFLSYVGMVTTSLTLICLSYCCCSRCCHRRCPKFSKWWEDNNPCTTIIFKPRIVNSVHPSSDSMRRSGSRATRVRYSLTDAAEATEPVCLDPNVKTAVPSGKRWKCAEGFVLARNLESCTCTVKLT